MLVYVTEHTVSGLTDAHLRSVRAALTETIRRLSLSGNPIQLLECSYVPEQRHLCMFAATAEAQVRQALDLAQLPLAMACRADLPIPGEIGLGRLSGLGSEPGAKAPKLADSAGDP